MRMALEALDGCTTWNLTREQYDRNVATITALRAAIAEQQDWSEVEALRESLREHMAEIHRLKTEGEKHVSTLGEALVWQGSSTETKIEKLLERIEALEKRQRAWVGLTDEDLSVCDEDGVILARYWEAKLKERNT